MTEGRERLLAVLGLAGALGLGIVGLRHDARRIYTSTTRTGEATLPVRLLMGRQHASSDEKGEEFTAIDPRWFTYEDRSFEEISEIGDQLVSGQQALGARTVACMPTKQHVEFTRAHRSEIDVCLAAGVATEDIARCDTWKDRNTKLVLLQVTGQDVRLSAKKLTATCIAKAEHWLEWNQRR